MLCPFCQVDLQRIVFRHALGNANILALWDGFPVSPGHLLLVPSRHVATWFDASLEEQQALMAAIEIGKSHIEQSYKPNGYNIGINVGP
ncbi:MAG: HIT family protein, partial [Planctomycetota bacterium]